MPRYANHDLHGLLAVDKPVGVTSMAVVRRVRRAAGNCKTGHCGTLDPLASGLLICALGKGTKAVPWVMGQTKVYDARVDLSAFTATDDAEGPREEVAVSAVPEAGRIAEVLKRFVGRIQQVPPAYSALKVGGRPAYRYARQGQALTLEPRWVRIDEILMQGYAWPLLELRVTCGQGTYIRSLARQIGEALGSGGHLAALRRTRCGLYSVAEAIPLEQLPQPLTAAQLLPLPERSSGGAPEPGRAEADQGGRAG